MRWEDIDTGTFETSHIRRGKDGDVQDMELPERLRPFVAHWWMMAGQPTSAAVFPVRRSERAGKHRKRGTSHAARLRRDLRRALGLDQLRGVETQRRNGRSTFTASGGNSAGR
jgi:hypothetical protein